ncbi:hypothetical protein OXX80_006413 [Metschnikowia pulcherrima]
MPDFEKLFKRPVEYAYKRFSLFQAFLLLDFMLTIGGTDTFAIGLRYKFTGLDERRRELEHQRLKDESRLRDEQRAYLAASSDPR